MQNIQDDITFKEIIENDDELKKTYRWFYGIADRYFPERRHEMRGRILKYAESFIEKDYATWFTINKTERESLCAEFIRAGVHYEVFIEIMELAVSVMYSFKFGGVYFDGSVRVEKWAMFEFNCVF